MLPNEEHCSCNTPNMATINVLLYQLQKDAKLKYSNVCASVCCTSHTNKFCVIKLISFEKQTKTKKSDFSHALKKRKEEDFTGEKESLTRYIQNS